LDVPPLDAPEMKARLRRKSWLFREWDVSVSTGHFRIAYSGHGHTFEGGNPTFDGGNPASEGGVLRGGYRRRRFQSVRVDGIIVVKTRPVFWYVPRFDFSLGGLPATVEVRVWPWLTLRAIRLEVGGEVCYTEGSNDINRA
jgi:hypothetical protein